MNIPERLAQQLEFLRVIDGLKLVVRQTLLIHRRKRSFWSWFPRRRFETDAEHMWEVVLMAMVLREYADEPVDILQVICLLAIHDIVELIANDHGVYSKTISDEEKARIEEEAAQQLFGILPPDQAEQFLNWWHEFQEGKTAEARFAKAMDKLQPLQHSLHTKGEAWHRLGLSVTPGKVLHHKRAIADSSTTLWNLVRQIVRECEEQGYFPTAK